MAEFDTDAIRDKHDQFQLANAREWQPIAYELRKLLLSHDLDAQDKRIVEDMLESLELYGIRSQELRWDVLPKLYAKQPLSLSVMDAWPS
ncbi:hypothetical protein [Leucothrix pacifica]|uniref:hypothetical protein n=1 Tax=Leucothrix pacifica TaxID=1247513 RepID=UPI0011B223FA|nr:hypothetical protein [Leucothrix pacifica]